MRIKDKGKITMLQAVLLFLIMTYSATMRLVSHYTIEFAQQAAWLAPTATAVVLVILCLIIKLFTTKYPNENFADIICKVMGKPIGKVITALYVLWFIVLMSIYVRYFGERLLSSIYPNADIRVFLAILLIVVGIVLRSGIVVLSRMNKLIFPVVGLQFFIIMALLLKKVDVDFLTPISQKDIVPVLSSTPGVAGIWVYLFFVFMMSDKIMTHKSFKGNLWFSTVFIWFATTSIIVIFLGVFGAKTILQFPLPMLTAVKTVSRDYTGFESLFLSLWILADFTTVAVFGYLTLRLLKSLFSLSNPVPLLSIILLFIYILSLFLCTEVFELQEMSMNISLPFNIFMGLAIPILVVVVGKIRRKL